MQNVLSASLNKTFPSMSYYFSDFIYSRTCIVLGYQDGDHVDMFTHILACLIIPNIGIAYTSDNNSNRNNGRVTRY